MLRSTPQTMGASSSKGAGEPPSSTNVDPELKALRSICASFHSQCRNPECKADIPPANAKEHIETWLASAQRIPPASQVSGLTCSKCYLATCAGCGFEPSLGNDNIFTSVGVVNSCCPRGRLYGIWLLLSRFDELEISARKVDVQKTPSKSKKKQKGQISQAALLTPNMATQIASNGVGYAGGYETLYTVAEVPVSALVDHKQECPDKSMTTTLKLLTASLPITESDQNNFSILPELLCLFRFSLLFDHIAALIRNDSITDLVERRDVYQSVFAFIEAIANHPGLVELLFEKRLDKKHSPGLSALCLSSPSFESKELSGDLLASLFSYGINIYRQAKAFMEMVGKTPETSLEQGKESVRMCSSVIALYETMQAKRATDNRHSSEEDYRDLWTKFSEENRVTFSDDVLKNHRYHSQFTALTSSPHKGRLSTIGKEIANMTTSLPAGIFLKVAESRSDVMKVLIVGTEGTPYAGGLFTFDLYLDGTYPITPPMLSFILNGNDSELHSFNPNLHRGGGVCLSIINTWQGTPAEMWQPNKSTILAVLISVQAMILGAPIPWINEPGFHGQGETSQAIQHKLLIQYKTVKYAMLGWLDDTMPRDNVWDEINKMYWKYKGLSVMLTVKEWTKDNSQLRSPPKPKQTRKSKAPDIQAEDLVEKLELLLDIGTSLEAYENATEESLTNSSKASGKGKGKRKASDLSDEEPRSDADAVGGGAKRQKGKRGVSKGKPKAQQAKESEKSAPWVYTASKTQKEVRRACTEFGIGAASTIKDTIAKLERYVNDHDLMGEDLAKTWGLVPSDHE